MTNDKNSQLKNKTIKFPRYLAYNCVYLNPYVYISVCTYACVWVTCSIFFFFFNPNTPRRIPTIKHEESRRWALSLKSSRERIKKFRMFKRPSNSTIITTVKERRHARVGIGRPETKRTAKLNCRFNVFFMKFLCFYPFFSSSLYFLLL